MKFHFLYSVKRLETFKLANNKFNINWKSNYSLILRKYHYLMNPRRVAKMHTINMAQWDKSARKIASCETCWLLWPIRTKNKIRQIKPQTNVKSPKNNPFDAPIQSVFAYAVILRLATLIRSSSSPWYLWNTVKNVISSQFPNSRK